MKSIYTSSWVLPISSPPIRGGAVVIEADRVVAVGAFSHVQPQFPDSRVVDLGEAAILPGLINIHSHLELTAFRGRLEESHFQSWIAQLIRLRSERMSEHDLIAAARLGCLEAIKSGVTTLADTSSVSAPLIALIESGLRGVVFQECFGPHAAQAENSLDELKARLDSHLQRLSESGGEVQRRLRIGLSPHAPYSVSARLYEMTARFALDQRFDVAIHTAESDDEVNLLSDGSGAFGDSWRRREIECSPPGCSPVEYFDRLGVLAAAPLLIHCVKVDEQDIELIAQSGSRVAHCPKSNAKFGHGVAPLLKLQRAGVPVGLGSDSVASNNSGDLIEEARFCSLTHRAVNREDNVCSAAEMLRLMTIDGARALKIDDQVGSLEPGKQADLIAVNLATVHSAPTYDPATTIIFSSSARDVILTMVAGRVLFDGQQVATIDEQQVAKQIREISAKLSQLSVTQ